MDALDSLELVYCAGIFLDAAADRPSSAASIRGGGRQRLQHPNARRVHAVEKVDNMVAIDLEKNSPTISTIALIEKEPTILNNKDKSNIQEDTPIVHPLRKLILKKSTHGPIEVKALTVVKHLLIHRCHSGFHSLCIPSYR